MVAVLDLYSRKIVGWAMTFTMPAELGCRALQMAICQRQLASGLIVHSDRDSQYASQDYQALLGCHGVITSMSRKGNCWEGLPLGYNSVMERFLLNLKYRESLASRLCESSRSHQRYNRLHGRLLRANDYIPHWAIDLPTSMSVKWFQNNLLQCPKKLDHYSFEDIRSMSAMLSLGGYLC